MSPFIQKTLGGLSREYYLRQLFFGFLIFAIFFSMLSSSSGLGYSGYLKSHLGEFAFFTVSAFLYPYSRFVYDTVFGFLTGENTVFVLPIFLSFALTAFTTFLCFMFAIIIAPVGLLYLFYVHTKQEKQIEQ